MRYSVTVQQSSSTTPVSLGRWPLRAALAALLLAACSSQASMPESRPESQAEPAAAPAAGQAGQAGQAADTPTPAKQAMTNADTALSRINDILKQHPATEQLCGEKQSVLSREGSKVVLESAWTKCPGRDRSEVELAVLDPGRIRNELEERYGQARVFVPCRADEACSGRFTRNPDESAWRHLRDEPVLSVDCAADAAVLGKLEAALRAWIEAAQAEQ